MATKSRLPVVADTGRVSEFPIKYPVVALTKDADAWAREVPMKKPTLIASTTITRSAKQAFILLPCFISFITMNNHTGRCALGAPRDVRFLTCFYSSKYNKSNKPFQKFLFFSLHLQDIAFSFM